MMASLGFAKNAKRLQDRARAKRERAAATKMQAVHRGRAWRAKAAAAQAERKAKAQLSTGMMMASLGFAKNAKRQLERAQAKRDRDAATKMQAVCRGRAGRVKAEAVRLVKRAVRTAFTKAKAELSAGMVAAAITFEQRLKKKMEIAHAERRRKAATRMQAAARGWIGRALAVAMREERRRRLEAATRLQAVARGKSHGKSLRAKMRARKAERLRRFQAAATLQAVARGKSGRARAAALRAERRKREAAARRAAVKAREKELLRIEALKDHVQGYLKHNVREHGVDLSSYRSKRSERTACQTDGDGQALQQWRLGEPSLWGEASVPILTVPEPSRWSGGPIGAIGAMGAIGLQQYSSRPRQPQEPLLPVIVRSSLLRPIGPDEGRSSQPTTFTAFRMSNLKSVASVGPVQHPTMHPTPQYLEPRDSTVLEREWARRARVEVEVYRDRAEIGSPLEWAEMSAAEAEIYRGQAVMAAAEAISVDEWGGGWRGAEAAHHHSRLPVPLPAAAHLTPKPPQQLRPSKLETTPSPRRRHGDGKSSQTQAKQHGEGKSGIMTWTTRKVRDSFEEEHTLLFPVIPTERTKRSLQSYA